MTGLAVPIAAAAGVGVATGLGAPQWAVPLGAALAGALWAAIRRPQWYAWLLLACLPLEGYSLDVAEIRIKPIHVAGIVAGLWWLRGLTRARRVPWPPLRWALAFLALGVASILWSVSRRDTAVIAANLAFGLFLYTALAQWLRRPARLRTALGVLAVTGGVAILLGLVQVALYQAFDISFGTVYQDIRTFEGRPAGTFVEAVWYGIFCMSYLLLFVPILSVASSRARPWLLGCLGASALGLIVSLTRSAWIGAAAGLAAWVWLQGRLRIRPAVWLAGLAVAWGLLWLSAPEFHWQLLARAGNLLNPDEHAAQSRLRSIEIAADVIPDRWLAGHGLGSWSQTAGGLGLGGVPLRVGTSLFVNLGNDLGLLGILLYGAWLLSVCLPALVACRAARGTPLGTVLAGGICAVVGLLFVFQFSNGYLLAFWWAHLGLLAAATGMMARHPALIARPRS